ncbi:MAG: WD40 repeat domain-containing protein [Thermomicrobiales bacterium]
MISRRTLVQTAAGGAAALAMSGRMAVQAQHDPHLATPTISPAEADVASPAATAIVPKGALTVGEVRSFSVEGQPVAMSPDGKWLAGPGPDRGFCIWDVETLKPAGATDRRPMAVQLETVTWAPDSSAVAFSLDAARLLTDSDIYVMDIDGTLHDLTDDGDNDKVSLSGDGPTVPIDMYPAWSPDGSQLTFARTTWSSDTKDTALYTIDRDGGDPAQRFVVSPQEPFIVYAPMHWLADGSVIFSVLHADPSSTQNGIWRLTASGGVESILPGSESAEVPMPFVNDVSPDGTLATVMSFSRAGQFSTSAEEPVYFIVDLKTGKPVPVQSSEPRPAASITSSGAFLPDGSAILSMEMSGNRPSVVLSDLDGATIGFASLPEDVVGPVSYRGLSIATDGTVFMSTKSAGEQDTSGGVIFTVTRS